MKLLCFILLCSVAVATADFQGSYQPEAYNEPGTFGAGNYYEAPKKQAAGGLTGMIKRVFGIKDNRRQGLQLPVPSPETVFLVMVLVGGGLLAIAAVATLFASLSTSGRGLDSDEWEVNHSVWLQQLNDDFEDSWAQ